MLNSKQIFSTALTAVPNAGSATIPIIITIQNAIFVCQGIGASTQLGNTDTMYVDISLQNSRDKWSSKPVCLSGLMNNGVTFNSADGAYYRFNGRPHFMIQGGETIQVTFTNTDPANSIYASLALIGYFCDLSGRNLCDNFNIPAQVLAKL